MLSLINQAEKIVIKKHIRIERRINTQKEQNKYFNIQIQFKMKFSINEKTSRRKTAREQKEEKKKNKLYSTNIK